MTHSTPPRVLVFSHTAGYRHESTEAGVAAILRLGETHGFPVDTTEDAQWFDANRLADYDAVVWMQVSGNILSAEQRSAYERYTALGGGYIGVHAASDAERGWPLYDQLVGARFESHPPGVSEATLRRTPLSDQSTAELPHSWRWTDEWYHFDADPSSGSDVLLSVNECPSPDEGADNKVNYPVTWRRRVGAAHAWYTSLGHEPAAFNDSIVERLLFGAIKSVSKGEA